MTKQMSYPAELAQENEHFASGVNAPGEARGLALSGRHVGITATEIRDGLLDELAIGEHGLQRLFVDSGAFSEVKFGPEGMKVVKEITDADWQRRFQTYRWAAATYRRRAFLVAPDRVGCQTTTLARLERYAAEMQVCAMAGANIIVPVQKGELPMSEMFARSSALLGLRNLIAGVPMKKDATSMEDLAELVDSLPRSRPTETRQGARIHLLGLGPESPRFAKVVALIKRLRPYAQITSDSVTIRRLVGRTNGRGGGPRALTAAQDRARAMGVTDAQEVKAAGLIHQGFQEIDADRKRAHEAGWYDEELFDSLEEAIADHREKNPELYAEEKTMPKKPSTPPQLSLAMEPEQKLINIRPRGRTDRGVEVDATITEMLAANSPVAIGVSGGKDSCAAAIATVEHLRAIGHAGPMILVHSDLGDKDPAMSVEWDDSLPTCERLAAFLGVELMIVRRKAGGMMQRWIKRWENNVARYTDLSCVKIILPWSTPSMRFCTSELKSAPIASALVKRFPGCRIVSACGIRREEGRGRDASARTNAPTQQENPRLTNKRAKTTGVDWNPIAHWTELDVFSFCAARGFEMHEGYGLGMNRISCRFCIMQDINDQRVSASVPANRPVMGTMIGLEIRSTFGFQGSRWLADVAPEHLDDITRARVADAKRRAEKRVEIEAKIPKHLLYTKGWPTVMPTREEAELLAEVRCEVAKLLNIEVRFTDADEILGRYAALMGAKKERDAA